MLARDRLGLHDQERGGLLGGGDEGRQVQPRPSGVRGARRAGYAAGDLTSRVGACVLGGLVALGLPVPSAGQDDPVRTLRASAEPLVSIGPGQGVDSPYELFQVEGALRLADGSVVALSQGHYEVRRFGPDGRHLWTAGRYGEGPGEFELPVLLATCSTDDRIVIYDRAQYRVTTLNGDGELVDDYLFDFGDRTPYGVITCAPSGRMVFTQYGNDSQRPGREGPYRWLVDMIYSDGEGASPQVFRRKVPGADRMLFFLNGVPVTEGPRIWGRTVLFAPIDNGVWIGTADNHEIELVDWDGTTIGRIQWNGPGTEVTEEHIGAYRDELYEAFRSEGRDDWEQRFNGYWDFQRPNLPDRFPAYTKLIIADGLIWVRHFRAPGQPEQHWLGFNDDGVHVATMFLPSRMKVQDLGPDWVLAVVADPLGTEQLVVHALEGGGSLRGYSLEVSNRNRNVRGRAKIEMSPLVGIRPPGDLVEVVPDAGDLPGTLALDFGRRGRPCPGARHCPPQQRRQRQAGSSALARQSADSSGVRRTATMTGRRLAIGQRRHGGTGGDAPARAIYRIAGPVGDRRGNVPRQPPGLPGGMRSTRG